jgi:hypothetical protein
MSREEQRKSLQKLLDAAENEVKRQKTATAQRGVRIFERHPGGGGDRDITDQHLRAAEATCEEYRSLMRAFFPDDGKAQ